MLPVGTPAPLGLAAATVEPAAAFAFEAGAFCADVLWAGVLWATRVAAANADSIAAGDAVAAVFAGVAETCAWAVWLTVAGAGTALVFDATRTAGATAEVGAATFCAETTPKAARPRLINAATTTMTRRIVSLCHQRIDSRKVKAQSASESTAETANLAKDAGCGFRGK